MLGRLRLSRNNIEATLDPFEADIRAIKAQRLICEITVNMADLRLERRHAARQIELARCEIVQLAVDPIKLRPKEVHHLVLTAHDPSHKTLINPG